jgi:beta-glucosidase/6-phospho-beta-glucosidase/beta-galactosidase
VESTVDPNLGLAGDAGWQECYGATTEDGFPQAQSSWLYGSGWGFRKLLNWVHNRYNGPEIYVTEGGWSLDADTAAAGVQDGERTMYYANYTAEMLNAINIDSINVKGYYAWSLMDNFEWEKGFTERFGVVYNDYAFGFDPNAPQNQENQPTADNQVRTRKDSSCWLQEVWANNGLVDPISFGGCV